MASVVWLENSVESTAGLPPELQRTLETIRDLDDRAQTLAERIYRQVETCLGPKLGDGEVAKLRRAIEEDQRLLMHWAEEKVALANSLVSLLQLHSAQSARDLAGLEAELQAEAAAEGEMVEYMSSEEMKRYRLQELERERQDKEAKRRQRELVQVEQQHLASQQPPPSMDPLQLQLALTLPNGHTATSEQPTQEQGPAATPPRAASPAPQPTQQPTQEPAAGSQSQKEAARSQSQSVGPPRSVSAAAVERTPTPAARPQAQKRKAPPEAKEGERAAKKAKEEARSTPAAAAAAAATAAAPEREAKAAASSLPPEPQPAPTPAVETQVPPEDPAASSLDMPMPEWAPPGMSHAGDFPKANGRLLTYQDINEKLKHRRAELFWPADNSWYLIMIDDVDLENKEAGIIYSTGETESLKLEDIVKEGHMSLINDAKP